VSFDHYLSFGDSISIDDYAGPGLGAASLLYRNPQERWPEFPDLVTANPNCDFYPLARDGATLVGCWRQLEEAPELTGRVLATLTVGGNDLLTGLGQPQRAYSAAGPGDDRTLPGWQFGLERWVQRFRQRYPHSVLMLSNIYDPSDGTDLLASGDGSLAGIRPHFEELNVRLRDTATRLSLQFADLHAHFLGRALDAEPWIYAEIEPTAAGANEIRCCWLAALA
jgi:hypothetical protein